MAEWMRGEKGVIARRGRYPRFLISTGMWIRAHLLEVEEDYPLHMWSLLRDVKRAHGIREKGIGSYQNFRNYIYWLRRLDLIRFVREEPSLNPVFKPRRYYTYVPENLDKLDLWANPRRALYPETWEKYHS